MRERLQNGHKAVTNAVGVLDRGRRRMLTLSLNLKGRQNTEKRAGAVRQAADPKLFINQWIC